MRNLLLALAYLSALAGWVIPQPVVAEVVTTGINTNELVRCESAIEAAKEERAAVREALGESLAESVEVAEGESEGHQLGPTPSLATVAACQFTYQQVIDHPFAPLFNKSADNLDDFDATALVDISRYYLGRQNELRLNIAELEGILKELSLNTVAPSFWERLWVWLLELVGSEVQEAPAWLEHLVPSEAFLEGFLYVVGVLLIVTAVVVVIIEVRRGRQRRRSYQLAKQRVADLLGTPPLSLQEVHEAPTQNQPSLLLAYILQELVERKRFSLPEPLTHRGVGMLNLSSHSGIGVDHSALQKISMAAERALYGAQPPTASEAQNLLNLGRELLHGLGLHEHAHE